MKLSINVAGKKNPNKILYEETVDEISRNISKKTVKAIQSGTDIKEISESIITPNMINSMQKQAISFQLNHENDKNRVIQEISEQLKEQLKKALAKGGKNLNEIQGIEELITDASKFAVTESAKYRQEIRDEMDQVLQGAQRDEKLSQMQAKQKIRSQEIREHQESIPEEESIGKRKPGR